MSSTCAGTWCSAATCPAISCGSHSLRKQDADKNWLCPQLVPARGALPLALQSVQQSPAGATTWKTECYKNGSVLHLHRHTVLPHLRTSRNRTCGRRGQRTHTRRHTRTHKHTHQDTQLHPTRRDKATNATTTNLPTDSSTSSSIGKKQKQLAQGCRHPTPWPGSTC